MTVAGRIAISIDYEVYWTFNESERAVLLDPTDALMSMAEDLGVRLTIFCDTLCLFRYQQVGRADFVTSVENQLRRAISVGHDVQAHIHPHWPSATWSEDDKEWQFEADRFLLATQGESEDAIYEKSFRYLKTTKDYLESLLQPIDSCYETNSFRAGGYGIQPGDRAIIRALLDAGYKIDSSIVPGKSLKTARNAIDFSDTPDRGNYYIGPQHGIARAVDEGIWEVPIAGGVVSMLGMARRVTRYLEDQKSPLRPIYGYGHSIDRSLGRHADRGTRMSSLLRKVDILLRRYASLHVPEDPRVLFDLTANYFRKYRHEPPTTSLLVHPKGLTNRGLSDIRSYVGLVQEQFGNGVDFPTFLELATEIGS